jgi:hypothetical protein
VKRPAAQRPLSLDAIEDELAWAHGYIAESVRRRGRSERSPLQDLELWTARELLRIELTLLALSADPTMAERLAQTRATLALIRGFGDTDDDAMSLPNESAQLWSQRAPGATDDVLARCAASEWTALRRTAAKHLRVDHPPSAAALDALTRDANDWVKTTAVERLGALRELPWWKLAFSRDPLDGLSERARRALAEPLAAVRAMYDAPPEYEPEAVKQERVAKLSAPYAAALDALSDALLIDHANVVLNARGPLSGRAHALVQALGSREKSLDALLSLLDRAEHPSQHAPLFTRYFSRFAERSTRDRAATLLQLTRWLHDRDRDQRDSLALQLSHSLPWKSLWPAGLPQRPWFELLVELAAQHVSAVVGEVLRALGLDAMPASTRLELLERWARGERSPLFKTIRADAFADALAPRARWTLAQTVLRERRSSEAMAWAMTQWTGPLYDAKRDGALPALAERLCADVELRATVLRSHALTTRCLEPLRALFNDGAIAQRRELGRFVISLSAASPDPMDWSTRWYFRGDPDNARLPDDGERTAALSFARDARSLDPLSAPEWERVRALRSVCFRRDPLVFVAADAEMFPLEDWEARDCEDFAVLCEQVIAVGEDMDVELLACMAVHQWQPALHASARALVTALDETMGSDLTTHWRNALRAKLAAASK